MANTLKLQALKDLPQDAPEVSKKLITALASCVPSEDAGQFDQELFEKMVTAHWNFAKTKGSGAPQAAVYYSHIRSHRKTVIDVVSDDMAFLVDSIAAEINKNNCLVDLLIHPIFYVKYNEDGRLEDLVTKPEKGYTRQSHIHVHIKNTLSDEALEILKNGFLTALEDVGTCNRDWKLMLEKLRDAKDELAESKTGRDKREIERYCAFLDYLYNNNFTLLGYREYEFVGAEGATKSKTVKGKSLGLLHDDVKPAYISETEEGLPRNLQELRRELPPVSVSKTNRLSTVHRRVPMDAIAVKTYDKNGKAKGEKLFLGLFTSVTYSRSVSDVPFLREKVEEVIAMSDFLPGSHNSKGLRHILEKYPRDELFQIGNEELFKTCLDILRLQERQRIALFMRRDSFGRYVSCLVYIPRDRFATALRENIMRILETELRGTCSNFYTSMDDSVFARVMFTINVSQKNPPNYKPEEIEGKIRDAGRTWPERLSVALSETISDDDEVTRLTLKYGEAFPIAYTVRYRSKQAVMDISKIETTLQTGRLNLDFYRLSEEAANLLRLKVYSPEKPLNLSDVLPILEDMDLRATSELPFEIKPQGVGKSIWIHDFLLETPSPESAAAAHEIKSHFEEAFEKIWYKDMESDSLNRLVLRSKLNWREVTILRTYVRYLRQIGSPFGRSYIESALVQNPKIARLLSDMFTKIHNPAETKDRGILSAEYTGAAHTELEKVDSADQDRILRSILLLMDATVRTNYFQKTPENKPKPYLSIKLESAKFPDLPEPKPYREIFVYSPRVEAVHLRSDKIARGGIRWSDRHEDFRTEVLGLMKAQMVKNAVIVPMGAKGGFIVKSKLTDRKAFQAEGIECYKIMIHGLLDVTDNLKGHKVVPPKDVVRLDGDDPYLVVAADKGTATFSDIANSISKEHNFWLGDAFASGGSAGYDHKKMGITARGAWEGIKLHFRKFNHNIQIKPFDVVGVGDMGGDVFGNAMLLSEQIHLIGAFNHIHIFCDPQPDAQESFRERKRLFENAMGWDHYDAKKLSKGGRIFSRGEKTLTLTPEIQKRFDLAKDKVSPAELIRAMLKARTDLLYFGGIGTYMKGSKQTHNDVGDKTNDNFRVDGVEIRAKVIGEGANLAVTQLGRIEYAEKGGKINTDFIDNSAGVDTSDHEVNIKILLSDVMAGKNHVMDIKSRNTLLQQMTDEVGALVLRDNYQQTQAISLAELRAPENLKLHEEFIQDLERNYGVKRSLEGLPDRTTVDQRLRLGKGMTRPELCILLAYAKITLTQNLMATSLPDNPDTQQWVMNYFPVALQKKFPKEISNHRLRREIIAMSVANAVINRMGPGFTQLCAQKTGADADAIAKAWLIVHEAYGLNAVWSAIEELDNKVPAEVQLKAMREVIALAQHAVTWFLTRPGDLNIAADIKQYESSIGALYKNLEALVTDDMREKISQRATAGTLNGLPQDLSNRIAVLPALSSACDITRISFEQKTNLESTARTYFEVGTRFHLDWLRQQALYLSSDSHWQAEATAGLVDNLYSCQGGLTVHILHEAGKGLKADKSAVAKWLQKHGHKVGQIDHMFTELRQAGTIDLSMLVIAEQRLRGLYGG